VSLFTVFAAFGWSNAAMAQGMRDFHADMDAASETKYAESGGTGAANFHLDLASLTLSWDVHFEKLSGPPTSIQLYGPAQPGANGAVIQTLGPAGAHSPLKGSAVITEAQVQYLLYGWTYINVTTARYPKGEIRGQLDVQVPKEVTQ
jgi:hypothetical protein